MAVLHITSENYEQEVLQSDKVVLIDFWASWCGPCKMLSPVIEELSEEAADAKICKVNVDEQPELASKFSVMSIPTIIIIKDKKICATSVGVKPKAELLKLINENK